MQPHTHTDHEFEEELADLQGRLHEMGGDVLGMLSRALDAMRGDTAAARDVIDADSELDRLEVGVDERCLRILARRQPVASDLRLIATALKVVTDLERAGDLCVNIAERTVEIGPVSSLLPRSMLEMGDAVSNLMKAALCAFETRDGNSAERVIVDDRKVDAFHAQVLQETTRLMQDEPGRTQQATGLQAMANALERMGDHAKNVAEMTIFMVQGRDVRHARNLAQDAARPRGVLFLCVHNAARSQMAEGWARELLPKGTSVWSAGSAPAECIDPLAVEAMREVGIDISSQSPKRITDVPLGEIDTVITLCSEEVCVNLPGIKRRETWAFPDPAAESGPEERRLEAYRLMRDELKQRICELIPSSPPEAGHS